MYNYDNSIIQIKKYYWNINFTIKIPHM